MQNEGIAVPLELSASIGGFCGPLYRIELRDGRLLYSDYLGNFDSSAITIAPTEQEWRQFRVALESINIWRWRKAYLNRNVLDGTQWGVSVRYADKAVTSYGSNSYPTAKGSPTDDVTDAFERFLAAVQNLLGGKDFG